MFSKRICFTFVALLISSGSLANSQESNVSWKISLRSPNAPKMQASRYRIALHREKPDYLVKKPSQPVLPPHRPSKPSAASPRVPNIVGLTIGEAYDKLRSSGFELQYNPKLSSETMVSRQSPLPETSLSAGGKVAAECLVRVPELKGLTIQQANERLKSCQIEGEIVGQYLSSDRILEQSKKAGSLVYALSNVKLITAAQVPNLVGMNASTANQALKAVLLDGNARTKIIPTSMAAMNGQTQIVSQGFAPGSFVARNRKMNVNIVQYRYVAPNLSNSTFGNPNCPTTPTNGGGKIRYGGGTVGGDYCPVGNRGGNRTSGFGG